MLTHPVYTRERIRQTTRRLADLVHADRRSPETLVVGPCVERITFADALRLDYRPAELGMRLGPLWSTYWFRLTATIPAEWDGCRVDLLWESNSEATLWRGGLPRQGFNSRPGSTTDGERASVRGIRSDAMLTSHARAGETIDAYVEVACNGEYGGLPTAYRSLEGAVLDRCELARFDPEAWRLSCDLELLQSLEADSPHGLDESWAGELLAELNRFCNVWSSDDRSTWPEASAILAALLAHHNGSRVHEMHAIGHAHIDTAWLWPLVEGRRKVVRTWSSQLAYLERYPDYRFAASQAQQYAWLKEEQPELFAKVAAHVRAGQWLPVGGSWVEPDCNLPSGESLVRQLVHGQRFFEQEFGRRCREFWGPDTFGYNGQLPQIMRGAGLDRFLTQKLSWNRFNQPPHHTFTWQGIDGSEVLAHFPPADTYVGDATVEELRRGARQYRDHDRSRLSMYLYGYGDGGGGPTPAMIERLARSGDLQGLPRTRFSSSDDLFDALDADCIDRPTIVGELYFEYHRGTYTSQAAAKRGNRRGERLLHDAEFLAAVSSWIGLGDHPRAELERAWQLLLLNQFHDILPGSSIGEVYLDCARDHAEVADTASTIAGRALTALAGRRDGSPSPVNTVGFERLELAEQPGAGLERVRVPPYGIGSIVELGEAHVTVERHADRIMLDNGVLRAVLGLDGSVLGVLHRASGRETLAATGNVLRLYDDRPIDFDAWDIDPFHLEAYEDCPPADSYEVTSDGAMRAEVMFARRVGAASSLRQIVRLDAGARRLEFRTTIDWREQHRLLKVLFPLAVRAPSATYEMQFGVAERPTHFSTSHDLARFEVPGHRFADLSEHGFGAAILTDSTYGFSCFGHELRASLLRAPTWPDPTADMGTHALAYALLPHEGSWQAAGVVAEAACFNAPIRWLPARAEPHSFASIPDARLVIDTITRADRHDALVLRLYEPHGGRGVARLRLGLEFSAAWSCNLLEDIEAPLVVEGDEVVVPFRPWEIISVLVR